MSIILPVVNKLPIILPIIYKLSIILPVVNKLPIILPVVNKLSIILPIINIIIRNCNLIFISICFIILSRLILLKSSLYFSFTNLLADWDNTGQAWHWGVGGHTGVWILFILGHWQFSEFPRSGFSNKRSALNFCLFSFLLFWSSRISKINIIIYSQPLPLKELPKRFFPENKHWVFMLLFVNLTL